MTIRRRDFCIATGAVASSAVPGISLAQTGRTWPDKPIHFVTPYPPGGLSDQITRLAAERIGRALGATVVVDNKPGAGATMGTDFAARAPADGYTFLVAPTAAIVISPWLRKVNFTVDDFEPVAKLTSSYGLVTARKDAPFNNYREFVTAAKAAPGKYTFATNGVGTIVHLTAVLLHKQAGIDVVHVPYKGSVESMTDLLGGRVDLMYDPVTMPRVRAGDLKGLAVTNAERNADLPNVPTLAELGFKLEERSWFALFAPRGTPADIVRRVSMEAGKAMAVAGTRPQLALSAMYPDFQDAATFTRQVRDDNTFYRDIIQKENIKAD